MQIAARAYIAMIKKVTSQLGATLPPALDTAFTAASGLREAADRIEGSAEAANFRIIDCLKRGVDWHTDKQVQALVLDRVVAANGIRVAADAEAEIMVKTALTENADSVVEAWRTVLAPDAAALTVGYEELRIDDLAGADTLSLTRRNLVNVWADARTAVERFHIAIEGWNMLAAGAGVQRVAGCEPLILTDSLTPAEISSVNKPDAWTLTGLTDQPLQLATLAEYRQRASALQAEYARLRSEQEQRNEQALVDSYRLYRR